MDLQICDILNVFQVISFSVWICASDLRESLGNIPTVHAVWKGDECQVFERQRSHNVQENFIWSLYIKHWCQALVPSTYFFHSYLLCLIKHMVVSISSLTKFEHCCHSFVAQFQTLALNSIDWMLMLSYAS